MKERNERTNREENVRWRDKQAWIGLASACLAVVIAVVLIFVIKAANRKTLRKDKDDQ